jgi:hypothetical protein
VHFELKKKYKGNKLEKFCYVDSDALMENLWTSFTVEAVRFLAEIFRNGRQIPQGRRWDFEEKMLALSLLKCSPKSYNLLHSLLPLPSIWSLQSILNTVPLKETSVFMHFVYSNSLWRRCLVEIYIVVSYLMKCQSERTYISIRSLTALRGLRVAKVWAGHAALQIMLWSTWSMAYVESRNNQCLTTCASTKAEVIVEYLLEVFDACRSLPLIVT